MFHEEQNRKLIKVRNYVNLNGGGILVNTADFWKWFGNFNGNSWTIWWMIKERLATVDLMIYPRDIKDKYKTKFCMIYDKNAKLIVEDDDTFNARWVC